MDDRPVPACPDVLWPAWLPVLIAAATSVLGAMTLLQEGFTEVRLVLIVVAAGILWLDLVAYLPRLLLATVVILAAAGATGRGDSVILFAIVLACGEAASTGGLVTGLLALGVATTAITLVAALGPSPFLDFIGWYFGSAIACVGSLVVRSQLQLTAQLRANQETLAVEAMLNERRRLAREIHDVIAHSMTVTMLHVAGARLALQDDPPNVAEALDALVEAEHQGRQSLADIRSTVGLLNASDPSGDEGPLAAPAPGMADLADLVATYREAGISVAVRTEGSFAALSPATGLAAYRILQESLANAAKHAPGAPVEVGVHVGRRRVEVIVDNGLGDLPAVAAPPVPGGGRGTAGMAERARQLGGKFESGPRRDGWRVRACLPVACEPAAHSR